MIRELPNSPEAEISLLSCCFNDLETISRSIVGGIRPDSFYDQKRSEIFAVVLDLYLAQKPCEVYVVAEEMNLRRKLDPIGGIAFIAEIASRFITTAQAGYFIQVLREKAALRRVIRESERAVERCYAVTTDFSEAMAEIASGVASATGSGNETAEVTFQQVGKELHDEMNLPKDQRKAQDPGMSWGLLDLDLSCGKMLPGALVVLAGMPSTGKSALADQTAWHNAQKGHTVLIFTYEMTKRDKAIRIAQQQSRLNYDNFDEAPVDRQREFIKATKAVADCKNLHVFERDTSANRLIARTRAFAARGKVGLVVVDFLQYLSRLEPTIGKERTDEKLGRLTAASKQLASECMCPVMLLSSLNRGAYADKKRPTMDGLKNSGEIESDADQLGILHWPETNPLTGSDQDPHDQILSRFYVEFNQEKGRSKGVKTVGISFDRTCTRFDNYTR